jgi:hypothetical protein
MALTSTKEQVCDPIAILKEVEHRLSALLAKTPQLGDPLTLEPAIFQPDDVDDLIDLWTFVQAALLRLIESQAQE